MFAQTDLNKLLLEIRSEAGPLCVVLGMWFFIVLALGIVLRTACTLFNGLVGGKDSAEGVPVPTILGAMVMVFLSFIITFALVFALMWAATALAQATNSLNTHELLFYSGFGSMVLFFVVLSVLLALFLPAPIFRSFLISILCVPVAIILFVGLCVIVWLVALAFNLSFPAFQRLPFIGK
jgi:hypothetical protein